MYLLVFFKNRFVFIFVLAYGVNYRNIFFFDKFLGKTKEKQGLFCGKLFFIRSKLTKNGTVFEKTFFVTFSTTFPQMPPDLAVAWPKNSAIALQEKLKS